MNISPLRTARTFSAVIVLSIPLLAHPAAQPQVQPSAQAPTQASAQPAPAYDGAQLLPRSPLVTIGTLPNGLTYYIQKNGKPEKKLELRLVVKAGSILEDEDQQGLAHFTEHMAFNGSTHFKRHELTSYLQSIGVKFGADLNAYTGFDETVYVLPIPTHDRQNVEKAFLVLQDWAQGIAFNEADIDSERGIVLEELRLGKGAGDRINKILMPKLFNGSRYAERLPIGKESVIKTFKPDAIKRFYKDWYRPDLMAVIAVGDIEPAEAQALIKRYFGGLVNPPAPRPREYAVIPERKTSEAVVITDKEATANVLYIRYPILAKAEGSTYGAYRDTLIEGLYSSMLSQRMQELTQQADPPFIQGGSSMGKVVRGYRSFSAVALLGKGGVTPAINALVEEDERARQFGFTASELDRAKKAVLRTYDRINLERDKSDSGAYTAEFIRSFLEQEAIPGVENEYRIVNQLIPGITLDEVNAAVRQAIPNDQKKLVVYTGTSKADAPPPVASALLAAVDNAEKNAVQAREEKVYATRLMEKPPKAGTIVKETRNKALGTTELTLGNGVKVVLKPTDFKNDQVLMSGVRFGGQSLYGEGDIFNARYASAIVGLMGMGEHRPGDVQKILAGKSAGAGVGLSALTENVSGASGSADIASMLEMAYLAMTQPRRDEDLYRSFIGRQREMARNAMSRPESVFADVQRTTLYGDHPRVPRTPRPEDFDRIELDRVLAIYKERFSSAKDFTFFIVGSFEVAKIKPLVATYLASLPKRDIPVTYKDLGVRPVKGVVKKDVYEGSEAKSSIAITFTGDAVYSEQEQMRFQALIEVLNIKLIETLREKKGLIYGGGIGGALLKRPYGSYSINISMPCAPDKVEEVIAATFAEIDKIKQQGPEAGDLDKVKANWNKNHQKVIRENGYWLGTLMAAANNGTDPAAILKYDERIKALKGADLQNVARRYFNMDNYVQLVLYPEKMAPDAATLSNGGADAAADGKKTD